MINLSDANSALYLYIDSLLLDAAADEPRAAPEGGPAADRVGAADRDSDCDTLRVLFIRAAGIPLAVAAADAPTLVTVERAALKAGVSARGLSIGLLNRGGREIPILYAGDMLFPNGVPAANWGAGGGNIEILMLENGECGLACDEIGERVALQRRDIEWCSQRKTRPWLSGMVRGHKRALLDTAEIARLCAPRSSGSGRDEYAN